MSDVKLTPKHPTRLGSFITMVPQDVDITKRLDMRNKTGSFLSPIKDALPTRRCSYDHTNQGEISSPENRHKTGSFLSTTSDQSPENRHKTGSFLSTTSDQSQENRHKTGSFLSTTSDQSKQSRTSSGSFSNATSDSFSPAPTFNLTKTIRTPSIKLEKEPTVLECINIFIDIKSQLIDHMDKVKEELKLYIDQRTPPLHK
jgi:hypothetical protein